MKKNDGMVIDEYKPPGPVCEAFIKSEGPIDLIMGPWGSGKTVGAIYKGPFHAGNLFPVCKDGVIHVKLAIIRNTYRELAKTTLASWLEEFPKFGPYTKRPVKEHFSGGQDRPVTHTLSWDVMRKWPDGWRKTPVEFIMETGAVSDTNLSSFFKGYQISMGYLNEVDLMHEDAPGLLYGRTGRYPSRDFIMPWEGERLGWETDEETGAKVVMLPRIVFGDYNPPDPSNWTYKRHIEEPEKWGAYNFFHQPSGLSAQGENRAGKSRRDYEKEEFGFGGPTTPDSLRNVHGQYAGVISGTPVYQGQFSTQKHISDEPLEPIRDLPFYMGFDGGGRPACIIGQFMPNGQFRGLREISTVQGSVTNATRFAEMVNHVLLRDFAGMVCGGAWGDPADYMGADTEAGDFAFMQIVSQAISVNIQPTHSNEPRLRIEAVSMSLRDIDVNTPGSIFDPRMKYLIRGFVSQYKLTKNASEGRTDKLQVDKNEYSHPHDAYQYLQLGYRGGGIVNAAAGVVRGSNIISINQNSGSAKETSIWDL